MTRKLLSSCLAVAAMCVATTTASAENLIVNGDFSAGNTGFGTQYIYTDAQNGLWYNNNSGPLQGAGYYEVTTNANYAHQLFTSFTDHTGDAAGLMMVVNGSLDTNVTVWSQEIAVEQNHTYNFSFWASSTYPQSPATLVSVGGIDHEFDLTSNAGTWENFVYSWFSGSNTSLTITIYDSNLASSGNDFALDDLSLSLAGGPSVVPVPEPSSMALLGLGSLGLGFAARRRRTAV